MPPYFLTVSPVHAVIGPVPEEGLVEPSTVPVVAGLAFYQTDLEIVAKELVRLFETSGPACLAAPDAAFNVTPPPSYELCDGADLRVSQRVLYLDAIEKVAKDMQLGQWGVQQGGGEGLGQIRVFLMRCHEQAGQWEPMIREELGIDDRARGLLGGRSPTPLTDALARLLRVVEKHRLMFLFFGLPKQLKGRNHGWETLHADDLQRSQIPHDDIDAEGEFLFRHRFTLEQFAQTAISTFGPGEGFKPCELTSDGKQIEIEGGSLPYWSFDELACGYLEQSSDALLACCKLVISNDPAPQVRQLVQRVANVTHDSGQSKWYSSMLVRWGYLAQLDEVVLAIKKSLAGLDDDNSTVDVEGTAEQRGAAPGVPTAGPGPETEASDPFAESEEEDEIPRKGLFADPIVWMRRENRWQREVGRHAPTSADEMIAIMKELAIPIPAEVASRVAEITDMMDDLDAADDMLINAIKNDRKPAADSANKDTAPAAGQESNPDFARGLSGAIAAAVCVNELDRMKLLYPHSINEDEIARLRKTLADWIETVLGGQGFEQVKKAMSDPAWKACGDSSRPGLLLLFHPEVKVTNDKAADWERMAAIVAAGQKQSPVAEIVARVQQIQICDCRMPEPVNDKTYQEPKRLLMMLQHYWGLCRALVLDQTDAEIGWQPHPLLPLTQIQIRDA